MNKISYITIFKEKEYCKIILANCINRIGDSIDAIALTWLIYELSKSPALSALNFGINFIPTVFLQPIAGAFVEKRNKKKLMILCDIARGLIVAFIALSTIYEFIQPWMLILCTLLISSFEALRQPCGSAILPLLLSKDKYTHGMSLSATMQTISELIGTALAGVIIGLWGIGTAILIDALSFIISAIIITFTKIPYIVSNEEKQSIKHNFKEGLHYLVHNKIILTFCLIACYMNAALVPLNSFQSALVLDIYHLDSKVLSAIGIFMSVGMGVGSFIYPTIASKVKIKASIIISNTILGLFYFGCIFANYLVPNIFLFYAFISFICFAFGLSITLMSSTVTVSIMKTIDENYISRVMGIFSAICVAAMPITSFISSFVSLYFSIHQIFIGVGILALIITFICNFSHFLNNPEIQSLEE